MSRRDVDIELIALAKMGDQRAYTALFKFYYRWVLNFVKCMIDDTDDAKDITMLTFEKAFGKLETYLPLCEFRTWLFTIARNTTLDFIGYNNSRPHNCIPIELAYQQKVESLTPEQKLINEQNLQIIENAISQLSQEQQQILTMRYTEGLLCREIAERLNITINTVTGRVRYARQNLKKIIKFKMI